MLQQLGVTCDSTPVLKRKKGGCSEHKVVTFQFASDRVNILFEKLNSWLSVVEILCDVKTSGHSGAHGWALSVKVSGCQKLQMTA